MAPLCPAHQGAFLASITCGPDLATLHSIRSHSCGLGSISVRYVAAYPQEERRQECRRCADYAVPIKYRGIQRSTIPPRYHFVERERGTARIRIDGSARVCLLLQEYNVIPDSIHTFRIAYIAQRKQMLLLSGKKYLYVLCTPLASASLVLTSSRLKVFHLTSSLLPVTFYLFPAPIFV